MLVSRSLWVFLPQFPHQILALTLTFLGCRTLTDAETFCKGITHARPIYLDVKKSDLLDAAVAAVDIVICLGPYTLHVDVIKSAIKNRKNVVTTSYVSDAMMALEEEVKAAGITVMNEIGLDPGIDNLYAVKLQRFWAWSMC